MSARVYVPELFNNASPRAFLLDSYEKKKGTGGLYNPTYPFSYTFSIVTSIEDADLVLLPQPVSRVTPELEAYVAPLRARAKEKNIPLLAFVGGDLSHDVYLEGCLMLKGTQFKDTRTSQDIIVPPICEDLGSVYGTDIREKSAEPHVGFCGWSGFRSWREYLKYLVKVALNEAEALITANPHMRARRKGLYFRRKALRTLRGSTKVSTDFVERVSFGAHKQTITNDALHLREEFVAVIKRNDFTLAPKGDANYSVRFFETLSLSRIPILIDTLSCLPQENAIPYDTFMLRVPYENIDSLESIICSFYNSCTPEQFKEMQRRARDAFVAHLRYDSFFNRLFADFAAKNDL